MRKMVSHDIQIFTYRFHSDYFMKHEFHAGIFISYLLHQLQLQLYVCILFEERELHAANAINAKEIS